MRVAVKYLNIGDYFIGAGYKWKVTAKEPFTIYFGVNCNHTTNNLNPNTVIKIKLPRKYKKNFIKTIQS